jgi:hypothetical protein
MNKETHSTPATSTDVAAVDVKTIQRLRVRTSLRAGEGPAPVPTEPTPTTTDPPPTTGGGGAHI